MQSKGAYFEKFTGVQSTAKPLPKKFPMHFVQHNMASILPICFLCLCINHNILIIFPFQKTLPLYPVSNHYLTQLYVTLNQPHPSLIQLAPNLALMLKGSFNPAGKAAYNMHMDRVCFPELHLKMLQKISPSVFVNMGD